ncbi:MAG: hypothetical protein QOG13_2059 [Sphingomonadales bacterium]|jgi:Ni/Co efflux regulator RcnB|nr:hypothetical protein [Sphingomonadales bacterium]
MRKLSLSILAASIALTPSGAFAQAGRHGPPPGPRGPMHGPNMQMHGPNMQMHGPNMQMQMRHGGPMGGRHFQRRLQRGFVIPPFWFGSQFQIGNWQMYGFSDPGPDGRWIRYYDDAYLIDRGGRIVDSREGLDWDQYGEEWDMADGIPAYRGGRDYDADDEDDDGDREGHERGHGMHHGGPGYGYGGGHTQFYGGGYGYGMYAYPIVIETVTTSGGGYSEEVVEEYVEVRRAHHRPRARCVCRAPRPAPAPRPRPPAGERG